MNTIAPQVAVQPSERLTRVRLRCARRLGHASGAGRCSPGHATMIDRAARAVIGDRADTRSVVSRTVRRASF